MIAHISDRTRVIALSMAQSSSGYVSDIARLGRVCRERGIPVNVSTDSALCDFLFPGVARKGALVAGITAGGEDHSAARRLTEAVRKLLESFQ